MQQFLRTFMLVTLAGRLVLFGGDAAYAAQASAITFPTQVTEQTNQVISQTVFLADINAERVQRGLQPLVLNQQLARAANQKAEDMIANGYWEHFRPSDGKAPWAFIDEQGYNYTKAGENLARGFQTAEGITAAWMQSPAHRENILTPGFTEVGFACLRGTDGKLYTVQMLGSR